MYKRAMYMYMYIHTYMVIALLSALVKCRSSELLVVDAPSLHELVMS